MSEPGRIAIVGASLAGLRTAEFLRRAGFEGELTLIGEEPHLPYDRPPLSKEILRGEWEPDRLALRRKDYDSLSLDLRLGRRAIRLEPDSRTVRLDDDSAVAFDRLVVASGGSARRLPGQPEMQGVFVLRTLDDAIAIRDAMSAASHVAVIGAGFIGAEVAASARQRGLPVTMIEALDAPLTQSLGPTIGAILQGVHEGRGVEVHCGQFVTEFVGGGRLESLRLEDGTTIPCDLAVVGVGVVPAVDWLEGSGIALEDGVRCDETCESSIPGVYAVGDVASWFNPLFEERMRVEHWTNAVEQARHVASALVSDSSDRNPFVSVPMFWSDQYDIKIQGVGRPRATDELVLTGGTPEDEKFVALYGRSGRLVGAVTFNRPPKVIALRKLISERGSLEAGVEIAES
ncbi:MAG: FAD-dependent oxidoreductase [Myxococcota bacterium]